MSIPLLFEKSLHPSRVGNSLTGASIYFHLIQLVQLARRVDSEVGNDLIYELIAYHVVLGSQSLPCRAPHLDHFSDFRVDSVYMLTTH